jgi:transcription elongation factor Elf1
MIGLEKYKGAKTRHTCPACNSKGEFTRFVDENGNYLPDNVGICNRASKCGYSYTAKQFFADNPEKKIGLNFGKGKKPGKANYIFTDKNASQVEYKAAAPDFIPFEHLKATLGNYEKNAFVQFLIELFPDCIDEIKSALKMYLVGTYPDYHGFYTCFPSIDKQMRVCRAKLIRFNAETGKRLKDIGDTSSLPAKLKLKEDFNYKQIFFGEHLLTKYPDKPVAIVEAEKSSIIGSLCFPKFIWLASGSKQWLKTDRLQRLGNRSIILYPDADGFDLWSGIATDARRQGLEVKISSLIENNATDEQKFEGYDLADYLIQQQQREVNKYNQYVDADKLGVYEPDEQDLLDARLEREAILEYENTASA